MAVTTAGTVSGDHTAIVKVALTAKPVENCGTWTNGPSGPMKRIELHSYGAGTFATPSHGAAAHTGGPSLAIHTVIGGPAAAGTAASATTSTSNVASAGTGLLVLRVYVK